MGRRNLFQNIKDAEAPNAEHTPVSGYAARGATRNMLASIGELAERAAKADQIAEGEPIIDLEPDLIDNSFVSDRMEDETGFEEFVEGIRARGQDTPILVRPHPQTPGRYQIVFGHRRVRAAKHLGRKVKAVVRAISDEEHVIAQGQENSARENLSFIERALFAQRLLDQGYERQTIQTALSVDAPMLTRMLSVSGRVPEELALAIGPSKSIGRDRWIEFAQLIEPPEGRKAALAARSETDFEQVASEVRFERVMAAMKASARQRRATPEKPIKEKWQASDHAAAAEFIDSGRSFSVAFKSRGGVEFGRFIAGNLERLYGEFKQCNGDGKG